MRMTTAVCAVLAMLSMPTAATAQSKTQDTGAAFLAGLRSFAIVVEPLEADDAVSCSVGRAGLYTSLRAALDESAIDIVDDIRMGDGILYLNVTVLSNCTAYISLEVKAAVKVEKTGARLFAPVWERGRLRTGFRGASAGAAIGQSVEDTAKLLVSDWSSVNK
ncbi:MAG: hypothetical protein ACREMQ_18840 [Longimicrobiales bacterium]